jgi:uncharacterized 2Fe-2S/4Fe-4S cluster protein (DUF4445 family)
MPSGRRGDVLEGTSVLDAARSLGVDLDSVCGGRGICGRCQVRVSVGEFAKHNIDSQDDNLSPSGETDIAFDERKGLLEGYRLGCQAKILRDVVIDVPAESQRHKQVVRKRAEARQIDIDPLVRLHYVQVEEPDMYRQASDLRRVQQALTAQWDINIVDCDPVVLAGLQKALREGKWSVTVAVYDEQKIIAVFPGLKESIFGLAVDIGSTTIAAHLTDIATGDVLASAGLMNPQIRFGEDLMSRVSYVMMNPGGEKELTASVRDAINEVTEDVAKEAGIERTDILLATFVGNPVMHHLLLGIDPTELGGAPFALATDEAIDIPARELDLEFGVGARAYILPCIAGHVGADCAAVILSEAPQKSADVTLLVDVGTNAEIVLGNKDGLLAASSPTGPAFEGAQIASGQRAAPGAIERVRINRETLMPKFRVIGSEIWSDEPGFEKAIRRSGVTGICGSGIVEALAEMYLSGILKADGTLDGSLADRCPNILTVGRTFSYLLHAGEPEIQIYQTDVRAIQLAKAALYAGARLLMDRAGVEEVDRIVLAGAFGSHIDPTYAMVLGMIPDCEPENVSSAGNAAGTGARIALLNKAARREIEAQVLQIEKVETAVEAKFQEHFVDAMALPHASAPYTKLGKKVSLPDHDPVADGAPPRRRKRRRDRS